jgi:phage/plasmid-like protein (TIGR03299 family)
MSHEIDLSKGFAAIAYRGQRPWHQLGQEITNDLPLEDWRRLAGLNFDVMRRPVFTIDNAGARIDVPDRRALVRNDTQRPLAIVSDNYKVVQPKEVIEFFRTLVESAGFEMETAGALAHGKRVWGLARTGRDFRMPNADADCLNAYLLLATSYDAKFATIAQFTSIRVVCNNTLGFALREGERADHRNVFRVPHFTAFVPNDVKARLGLIDDSWAKFTNDITALSQTHVSKRQAVEFFMELMGYSDDSATDTIDRTYTVRKLLSTYETAPRQELSSAKDTAWGLVNAVTYFADHSRRARSQDSRMDSSWFGASARLKERAFSQALALAQAA